MQLCFSNSLVVINGNERNEHKNSESSKDISASHHLYIIKNAYLE